MFAASPHLQLSQQNRFTQNSSHIFMVHLSTNVNKRHSSCHVAIISKKNAKHKFRAPTGYLYLLTDFAQLVVALRYQPKVAGSIPVGVIGIFH
jgi:hypothetical protein